MLGYLNQFASKASGLGIAGLIVLLVTAIALILTIDKTLNNIWRVRSPRPFAQRCSSTGRPSRWGRSSWR